MAGTPAQGDAVTTLSRAIPFNSVCSPPVALVIVMVAAVSKDMPVVLVVGFFGTFGIIGLILGVRTDRKLRVDLGKPDAPWSGTYAASIPVDANVALDEALKIARRAVEAVRAHDVRTLGNHTAVGWVRSHLEQSCPVSRPTNLPWASLAQPEDLTQMICCARPRFSLAYFGTGMSQEWAERLQRAVINQL